METIADRMLRLIEQDAREKAGKLSRQILLARPQDKEEIMAGIEIERWLADSCSEVLTDQKCQFR